MSIYVEVERNILGHGCQRSQDSRLHGGVKATPKEKQQKAQRRQNRKRESITDLLPVKARPPDDDETIAS